MTKARVVQPISKVNEDAIVTNVQGNYNADYDILVLHDTVLKFLEYQEKHEVERLQEEINDMKSKNYRTQLQKQYVQKQIKEFEKEIEGWSTKKITFQKEVSQLLDFFKKAGGGCKTVYIGNHTSTPTVPATNTNDLPLYRLEIIRKYIKIANNYMPINLIETIPKATRCSGCDYDLSQVHSDETGCQLCPNCNCERNIPSRGHCSSATASMELLPNRSRTDNDERENFMRARMRYTGCQKDKFPPDLNDALDHYFEVNNLPTSKDIKSGKYPVSVLSREKLSDALSAIGYPLYEHMNLIMNKYVGTPLPDTTHIDNLLDLHFDLTQKVVSDLGLPPINTQFRLFKHLEMLGEKVHISQFRVPKTRELLEIDQLTWKQMVENSGIYGTSMGLKFIPTI